MKAVLENNKTTEEMSKIVDQIRKSEGSKSGKIKELFVAGMEIKDIAVIVGVRYNFVYNVVSNYARMNDIEMSASERGTKTKEILAGLMSGQTIKAVAAGTHSNYNQVWKINKDHKDEIEAAKQKRVEDTIARAKETAKAAKVDKQNEKGVVADGDKSK